MSEQKIRFLWAKSLEFPFVFDDLTYGDFDNFMRTLATPSNVFFELENEGGLISFTEVRPRVNAYLHFIFYDKHLKGKEEVMRDILADMFDLAKLRRITCGIPEDRNTGAKLLRRIGFRQEGTMRASYLRNKCYLNMNIYGLLREEL